MDATYHRQCKLSKQQDGKILVMTTWLPEEHARTGHVVKLKNGDGRWDDGWAVIEVHGRRKTEEAIERERDYLKNREASDA